MLQLEVFFDVVCLNNSLTDFTKEPIILSPAHLLVSAVVSMAIVGIERARIVSISILLGFLNVDVLDCLQVIQLLL